MINVNSQRPYFVCRDMLYIDNNKNFTYTSYSVGHLQVLTNILLQELY